MGASRRNVLLIMADQLAARWLPAYGHRVVQAPALDALASEATVFDSAYCPSPLCAPSRAATLTGRLPSRIGVYDNAAELPAAVPTVTHHLRAAGYATCLAGKMHFVGPDQLHGFEQRLTTDVYPADFEWTPDWRRPVEDPLPWYHTTESITRPGVAVASMQCDYDDEVAFRAVRHLFDTARHRREQPFFLVASFTHPHDPWELPPAAWARYDPAAIDAPAVEPIALARADPHSRRLRALCGIDDARLSAEQVRTARHAYYAAISWVDERIGAVLAGLRDAGLADDTVVAFTADHGEMLGERGLWYKMSFFEPSARVPLMIRVPGAQPRRVAAPVSLLDLAPTLLELAGAPVPDGLDGSSLAGLLAGGADDRPGPVVAEYLAEGVTEPAVMIRCGPLKFVACATDPDQLHDVVADPDEREDLAGRPERAAELEAFREEVARRWDLPALRREVLASQDERRQVAAALRRGAPAPWDFEPRTDASRQYVRTGADMYELQRAARLDARPAGSP